MNKEFIRIDNQIKNLLADCYHQRGFITQKSFTGFIIESENYKQDVLIGPTAEYSSSIVYRPKFNIINFKIQALKESIFGVESRFRHFTIIASQEENLAKCYGATGYEGWIMYDIKGEGDIQPMIEHHKEFMEKVGWQFLEQTQTVEGIHNYLNTPFVNINTDNLSLEEKTKLVRHNGADWMVNGLVAAWLLKDNNFNQLVENYRSIYFPEHIQHTMNTLIANLK
jgi:hypothetical protein